VTHKLSLHEHQPAELVTKFLALLLCAQNILSHTFRLDCRGSCTFNVPRPVAPPLI